MSIVYTTIKATVYTPLSMNTQQQASGIVSGTVIKKGCSAALLNKDFVSCTVIKRIGQQHFYTKILLAALLYLLRFCQQHYAALLYKAFVSSTVIQRICQQHWYTKILSAALSSTVIQRFCHSTGIQYKDFVRRTKQHCYTKALSAAMLP